MTQILSLNTHKIAADLLVDRFLNHLQILLDETGKEKFLLAISGGPDSMVLLTLFKSVQLSNVGEFVIGHVNHHLRSDSNKDQEFVQVVGKEWHVPVFIRHLEPSLTIYPTHLFVPHLHG